jgi:orotidine-5'-phosphate decarboxylase
VQKRDLGRAGFWRSAKRIKQRKFPLFGMNGSALPPDMASGREKLIVALDFAAPRKAEKLVATLGASAHFYKIGMELVCGGGLSLAQDLIGDGNQVFLDLKLHDIPITVSRACAQAAGLGAKFLTVHAYPQTMKAARVAAAGSSLCVLAVTVLTSYNDRDLAEAGYAYGAAELVARRAAQARAAGLGGLVLSAREVGAVRAQLGPEMVLVTPGIRPVGVTPADQKRTMTPAEAIAAGADYLVVGRPIAEAAGPRAAAEAIIADIAAALLKEKIRP